MPDIIVMPYLYLHERAEVGGWRVIPRADFQEADAISQDVFKAAPLYLDLYALPSTVRDPVGCIVSPPGGRVGNELPRADLDLLKRAVVAAVLDANRSIDDPAPNPGMRVNTSDNCALYGHPYSKSGGVAFEYGFMMRTLAGGLNIYRPEAKMGHSMELHIPSLALTLDDEYASALHALLTQTNDSARRLAVAIDWLDLMYRNTESLDGDTRIVALRAAFEVLLGAGDRLDDSRVAFVKLLKPKGAPSPRNYTTLKGAPKTEAMYDEEWWFCRFVWLRNAIMHGSELQGPEYLHDGRQHLHIADEVLRTAIKLTVIDSGFSADLMERPVTRHASRMIAKLEAEEAARKAKP